MLRVVAFLFAVLSTCAAVAADLPSILGNDREKLNFGPNNYTAQAEEGSSLVNYEPKAEKSPRLSFLYSVVLPGAGQFYAGDSIRAAVFFGIEAAVLGIYASWKGKGDDIEKEFRRDADEQWDPLSYLRWRTSPNATQSSITHALPCSTQVVDGGSLAGCGRVDVQQYYELIGKYNQYVAGWMDVHDANGNRVTPSKIDSVENFTSDLRLVYEGRRNDSNQLLKRASNIAGLILVNHVISAVDAARVTRAVRQGNTTGLEQRTRMVFDLRDGPYGQMPMLMAYKSFY